jgi:RNA polymerase sigma factor (sigma-70 family)
MSEYRVDIKVRNNLILKKINEAGYETLGEFCRKNNIMTRASTIGELVNMKRSPLNVDGSFCSDVERLCNLLNCIPDDLFTNTQMHMALKTNKTVKIVEEQYIQSYLESNEVKSLEDQVMEGQQKKLIEEAIKTLYPREQKIIRAYFALDGGEPMTYESLSKIYGVSRERIRGIVAVALRKLRHPSRTEKLKELVDNP